MDPRLLEYYNRELKHIREMGGEFAKEYPKIAGRLGLETFECADPYVERIIESFAYLSARVQLKVDADFPKFSKHLLEMVYPHYLCPTPSMTVVQFHPDLTEGALAEGFDIPRHSSMRSLLGKGEQTMCEYRTSHDLQLWPIEIASVEYFSNTSSYIGLNEKVLKGAKAGLRIRFRATAGLTFNQLSLKNLPIYIRGSDDFPLQIYEQIFAHSIAAIARSPKQTDKWHRIIDRNQIRRKGFEDGDALLPYGSRSFHGYRLIHEYFAFPQRFMFVELCDLDDVVHTCTDDELEIIFLFAQINRNLEGLVSSENFALYCVPAINLFPKKTDRIHINDRSTEFHVIPDRTRPMDFEVYHVNQVFGIGTSADEEQEFLPFYAANDMTRYVDHKAYFTVSREPRLLSSKQRRRGARSSYIGSEVFVSLVDANEAPFKSDLRQLALDTLCTNRDLPLQMSVGSGKTDLTLESGAPVESLRCVAGPSKPTASHAERETAWKLISHLSLNYLSLIDVDERQGAASLRELLMLYGDTSEAHIRKQIDGVTSITSKPITRRIPIPGPITFGRGLEITVTLDESSFEGMGVFLLGAVLEEFFAKYTSINSFTETVIATTDRGEIMRWPVRIGLRHVI